MGQSLLYEKLGHEKRKLISDAPRKTGAESEALIRWMFSLALRENGQTAEAESVLREALAIATKLQDDMLIRNLRAELDSLTPSV